MTTYTTDWRLLAWYVWWLVMFTAWAWAVAYFGALFAVRAHDEEGAEIERLRYECLRDEQDRTQSMLETLLSRGERVRASEPSPD